MESSIRVAVVGATGVVGRELLSGLASMGHPGANVTALASERSVGEEVSFGDDETLEVEKLTPEAFRGIQLALFAVPGDVARQFVPHAQSAGAWIVDVSPSFRFDPKVPLVHPDVNLDVLDGRFEGRVVACPSATGAGLFSVAAPLIKAFGGVERIGVTALMAASSAGSRGVAELEKQTADLLSGRDPDPTLFPHRIGFNVIPAVGEFDAAYNGFAEEAGWQREARRLFKEPVPAIFGTAVQVPLFYGHSLSLTVKLAKAPTEGDVREVLKAGPNLKVLDAPAEKVYPMPMLVTADAAVHVGRIRAIPDAPGGFSLFAAVDNAGQGAAAAALAVGSRLTSRRA